MASVCLDLSGLMYSKYYTSNSPGQPLPACKCLHLSVLRVKYRCYRFPHDVFHQQVPLYCIINWNILRTDPGTGAPVRETVKKCHVLCLKGKYIPVPDTCESRLTKN